VVIFANKQESKANKQENLQISRKQKKIWKKIFPKEIYI